MPKKILVVDDEAHLVKYLTTFPICNYPIAFLISSSNASLSIGLSKTANGYADMHR